MPMDLTRGPLTSMLSSPGAVAGGRLPWWRAFVALAAVQSLHLCHGGSFLRLEHRLPSAVALKMDAVLSLPEWLRRWRSSDAWLGLSLAMWLIEDTEWNPSARSALCPVPDADAGGGILKAVFLVTARSCFERRASLTKTMVGRRTSSS